MIFPDFFPSKLTSCRQIQRQIIMKKYIAKLGKLRIISSQTRHLKSSWIANPLKSITKKSSPSTVVKSSDKTAKFVNYSASFEGKLFRFLRLNDPTTGNNGCSAWFEYSGDYYQIKIIIMFDITVLMEIKVMNSYIIEFKMILLQTVTITTTTISILRIIMI